MKISVIIPLYNKASYIKKALQSVVYHTFTDWELIVVDDGSTDGSFDIARRFLEDTSSNLLTFNFQLLTQKNSGVGAARNRGVAASHGEFVVLLDADDWWKPTFLEEMNSLIADYPDAGIYGTSYYLVKNGKNKVAPIAFDSDFKRGYINYLKIYTKYPCMPLTSITVAVRRSVFYEMGGFKTQLKLGEDFDLWLRIALKYKVAMVNKPLAYYNQDVPVTLRATRRLHAPELTEYYFYSSYEDEYPDNAELKMLLDKKRVGAMMGYYLSKKYHDFAQNELNKVDWSKIPQSYYRKYYKTPIFVLKMKNKFMKIGSKIKQSMRIICRHK